MRHDVERWFNWRTSRVTDWPVEKLLAAKGNSSISVVLPALNEETTIGPIVAAIRDHLMNRYPLVDELVVMDSGSTDNTNSVAQQAGARVVSRTDVLPEFSPLPGKGEVLWRSLAATSSDIVAFVDSDLYDFTPDFVLGLLGPMLTDPGVQLVKATYDRPLENGETVLPAGGGRVTELVARPLINLFWPELAGFVQPLAGEYAARRSLLQLLPFPTGYGVEVGLLVDSLRVAGLDHMAQVDLGHRRHRHNTDAKLGQMSSEIMQAALSRLEDEGRLIFIDRPNSVLTQFERNADTYLTQVSTIAPVERPPIITVGAKQGTTDRQVFEK